jgi:hypothetical protein
MNKKETFLLLAHKLVLQMFPVHKMIEHCRINCGAASKKASKSPEIKTSFFKPKIKDEFCDKLVSVKSSEIKIRMFLKYKNKSYKEEIKSF